MRKIYPYRFITCVRGRNVFDHAFSRFFHRDHWRRPVHIRCWSSLIDAD